MGLPPGPRETGAGTVLALGLGLVLMLAMTAVVLLGHAALLASFAAVAAVLAALAAADAARGITAGQPCAVAAQVADRHEARLVACSVGPDATVQVRTELRVRAMFGAASGLARAGPPPVRDPGPAAERRRG